jgi:hypothetical protein
MADETRANGYPQSTVVHLNRGDSAVREEKNPAEDRDDGSSSVHQKAPQTMPPSYTKGSMAGEILENPQADWSVGGVKPYSASGGGGPYLVGLAVTAIWLGVCVAWSSMALGFHGFAVLSVVDMAALVGAAFVPISFLWLVIAYVDRGASVHREGAALREQLALLAYPSEAGRERVETMADSLRAQSRALSDATRDAAEQANALRTMMAGETRELSRLNAQIEGETRQALAKVGIEVQGLNAVMQRIGEIAHSADAALLVRQRAVEEAAEKATKGAENLTESLQKQFDSLVLGLKTQLEYATTSLQRQAEGVSDVVDGKISTLSALFSERTAELARRVSEQSDQVTALLSRQGEALDNGSRQAAARIEAQGHEVSTALERQMTTLAGAVEQQTHFINTAVQGEADRLGTAIEAKARGLVSSVERQSNWMTSALEKQASALTMAIARQTEGLARAGHDLSNQVVIVEGAISRQEQQVAAAQQASASLGQASEQLAATVDTVARTLAQRTITFEDAGKGLMRQAQDIAEEMDVCLSQSQQIAVQLGQRADELSERNRKLAETAHGASQELDAATAAALGDLNAFRDSTNEVLEGARMSAAAIRDAAQQADGVRRMISTQTKGLEHAARSLGEAVRDSGSAVEEQGAAISQTVEKAGERIRHMADLLSRNAVDITRTTARAAVEIEAVSETMKGRLHEVDASTKSMKEAAQTVLQGSEQAMTALSGVNQAVDQGAAALSRAGTAFGEQAQHVGVAANGALEILTRLGQEMHRETDQLFSSADAALSRAQALRDALEAALDTFEEGVLRGAERVDASGERLRVSAEVIEATVQHASDTMGAAGDDLDSRLNALRKGADVAVNKIETVGSALNDRQEQVERASIRADEVVRETGALLDTQAGALLEAADVAQKRARELQTVRERVDLQRFLQETSYAIEKLQAAAVDITRLFSPAVEEDLWKRFYKGEQNAFLRHAAKTITRQQATAVKKLFTQNPEFRSYAMRYMSEYETLLKAARMNDRADVLTAVFTSADMGRLYTTLARSTERAMTAE